MAGQAEQQRAGRQERAVGQRSRPGQLPARAGGQRREHREAFRETVLLGQERGREQHPARDRPPGTAHPPRRAKAAALSARNSESTRPTSNQVPVTK